MYEETSNLPNNDPQPKVPDPEMEEELNKQKILLASLRAKMKGMNKRRTKKSEKTQAYELKQQHKIADMQRQIDEEKQNVEKEQEKTREKDKLYANERAKSSNLKSCVKRLQSGKHKETIRKKAIKEFVEGNFKGKAQRKMLLNPGQKWAKNDREDIIEALVIRTLSPKTFEYLRKNGSLYMPSRHTINRHIDGIATCKPGYVHSFFVVFVRKMSAF